MADSLEAVFGRKKVVVEKLVPFGFVQEGDAYVYEKTLPDSGFRLTVRITADGAVSSEILDPAFHEPYTLHLAGGATGGFVGGVRSRYEEALMEIARGCFIPDVFQSAQAKALIAYAASAYGDAPEFLWDKFPYNAVLRRCDTQKWYAALLTVPKSKLGPPSDERIEILDLRLEPEELAALVDGKTYFPGYHMNKKNWYTIPLDGSAALEELYERLGRSYALAVK